MVLHEEDEKRMKEMEQKQYVMLVGGTLCEPDGFEPYNVIFGAPPTLTCKAP